MQNQTLGEEIPLTGTSFFLRYDSERQRGRVSNRSLIIPLSGATVPASLRNIKLTIELLGRTFEQTFPPQANQNTVFLWDGKDSYGRTVQGSQPATIKIAYVYDGVYQQVYNFGSPGTGVQITGSITRREIEIVQTRTVYVSNIDSTKTGGIGGWSLNVHHIYDPNQKALFQGDGKRRSVQSINDILKNSAGNGNFGFNGDGGAAVQAELASPSGVAIAPDGSYFIADSANNRIRKVSTAGIISTVVGIGSLCNPTDACGDGGQATLAQLSNPTDVVIGPDGSLLIADGDSRRVRRVATDGNISTVAGSGIMNCASDDVPARNACLGNPSGVAQAFDGSLYVSDDNGETDRIYRVGTNGIIKIVSNAEVCNNALTEQEQIGGLGPLRICEPNALAVGLGGNLFVASSFNGNVFKIDAAGNRSIVAGTTEQGLEGDGQPALRVNLRQPKGLALAPNGNILIAEQDGNRIRNIQTLLPSFTGQDIVVPSADGGEVFQFNSEGRHLRTLNALTNADKYVFGYDAAGRLITVTDGDGNITTIQRNGAGNPTGILSPYNQLTAFALDANGYLSAITNPATETTQFTYSSGGLMLTKRDALNNQNTFTYDSLGRLIRDDDAGTGFQTLARNQQSTGYSVTHNTTLNRTSTFDVENRPNGDIRYTNTSPDGTQTVETEGANGVNTTNYANGTITETALAPDPRWAMLSPLTASRSINTPNGVNFDSTFSSAVTLLNPFDPLSLVSKTDAFTLNGKTYTSVFTTNDRTFVETSPLNRQTTSIIDTQGRPTQIQIANLNAVNLTYDSRGRISAATSGTGLETRNSSFSYNTAGFLSVSTNPLNQTNNFTYDLAGRVTGQTLADNRTIVFGYDANSNLTSLTPPGRPAHLITYNSRNLVSSYAAPTVSGNSTTNYSYNLDKQITGITRPDALQINYAYDTSGRLQTLTIPNGNYAFAYNPTTGLLDSMTAPAGGGVLAYEYDGFLQTRQSWTGTVSGNVSLTYNSDLRVSSQKINDANAVDFTYDNDNLLTGAGNLTLTRNAQNGLLTGTSLGNVTDTLTYNGFAEPTNYNAKFNATSLYDVNYIYDKLGRISQKTENVGGVITTYAYGYDLTGRLTTVTLNGGPQPMVIYGYDNNDNRTSVNLGGIVTNAAYDNQDRLTNYGTSVFAYTANGELQSKTNGANTTQYSYDVIGNLRNVILPDSTQIEYLIDGQNRRIGKKVGGILTQGFLYQDQLNPAAELDANNDIVSYFVYASRSNTPDYMIKNGATYRLIYDQLGSIRLVVDVLTGNIAQRIDYDEFGAVLSDTNPSFQPFGFAGGLYDSQTRLTRFGARDYDAETGRWTIKDPKLFDGGETNVYVYAANDPINLIDPNGTDLIPTTVYQSYGIPHGRRIDDPSELNGGGGGGNGGGQTIPVPPAFDPKPLIEKRRQLDAELQNLIGKTDCKSKKRIAEIQNEIAKLTAEINNRIKQMQDFLTKYYPNSSPGNKPGGSSNSTNGITGGLILLR